MSVRLEKAKAAVEAAKDHQQGTQTWADLLLIAQVQGTIAIAERLEAMSAAEFLDHKLYDEPRHCAVPDCTIPPGNDEHCEAHA